jgi:acetoin utilization deacetylase AcuC-like enzyme
MKPRHRNDALGQILTAIPVCYSEELLADSGSFSPSAAKPRHVVVAWQRERWPLAINAIEPARQSDLMLAHDANFVRGVLDGAIPNGFGTQSLDVARSLPYTTGAMLGAARSALKSGCSCAPVSGFHHAHYDEAGGFCTFNGLVVAARKLIEEGSVQRVLILDCDMHYGDGTDQILEKLGIRRAIAHETFGRWFHGLRHAEQYLERLRAVAAGFGAFDFILYQAGADVHVEDPLGGILTTEQMTERDRLIFRAARSSGTPIAWNRAGGYQAPLAKVVALHVNTMRECASVYAPNGIPVGIGECHA